MLSPPTYTDIIEKLFTELDILLNRDVFQSYHALAQYLKHPMILCMAIFIVIYGYAVIHGWVDYGLKHMILIVVKFSVIATLALNWDFFSLIFVDGLNKGANHIADIMLSSSTIPMPHTSGEGINGGLQTILIEITKIGLWVWDVGSIRNWAPLLCGLLVWGFGMALIVVVTLEIFVAKVMLAILTTVAPLICLFLLSEMTSMLFYRWLGLLLGYALVLIFISSLVTLALNLMQWTLIREYAARAVHFHFVGFIPIVVVSVLGIALAKRVSWSALSIAGHVTGRQNLMGGKGAMLSRMRATKGKR